MYRFMLLIFSAAFVFFMYMFLRPLLLRGFSSDALAALPFLLFILLWYLVALRVAGWRGFGLEELFVRSNTLEWRRTALFWKRSFVVPSSEITEVRPVFSWHALSNRVEFTAQSRRHQIGDMLLRDETLQLAEALKRALRP